MKVVFLVLSVILLSFAITGCSNPVQKQLESLYRAIESQPDSVLEELQKIDTVQLRCDRDRALYALMITQAKYKSDNLELGDSSMLERAVSHYSKKTKSLEHVKIFFYRAKWMQLFGNTKNAMESIFPAYDAAKKLNNHEWVARTSELIADIYSKNFNNERVGNYTRETIIAYDKAKMFDNKNYAICDYALNLSRSGRSERAIVILDSIIGIATNSLPENGALASYARSYLFSIYLRSGDIKKAEGIGDSILSTVDEESLSKFELLEFAELNLKNNRLSDARYFLDLASTKPSNIEEDAAELNINLEISLKKGDYKSAYQNVDSILTLQQEVINNILASSSFDTEREYFQKSSENANKKNRELYWVIGVITFLSFVLIISISVIERLRLRLKKFQLSEKIREIFTLNDTIDNLSESKEKILLLNKNLKDELIDFKKQYKEISEKAILREINYSHNNKILIRLIEKYIEAQDLRKSDKLEKRIELEINKIGEKNNLKNQEKLLNEKLENIIEKIRNQCTFLRPSEIDFIIIQTYGLSPKILCTVFKIPQSTFYTLRARIKEKIEKSSVAERDIFLKFLQILSQ